jgi:hypothetical protein
MKLNEQDNDCTYAISQFFQLDADILLFLCTFNVLQTMEPARELTILIRTPIWGISEGTRQDDRMCYGAKGIKE